VKPDFPVGPELKEAPQLIEGLLLYGVEIADMIEMTHVSLSIIKRLIQ
jgi:hypothetical protein